jgi:hypothetical protein
MTRRWRVGFVVALFVVGLALSAGSQVLAQMGPGMMGGGATPSPMPIQQMSEVVKEMVDRLASGKGLDTGKVERLRRLADQLSTVTGRMARGYWRGNDGRRHDGRRDDGAGVRADG